MAYMPKARKINFFLVANVILLGFCAPACAVIGQGDFDFVGRLGLFVTLAIYIGFLASIIFCVSLLSHKIQKILFWSLLLVIICCIAYEVIFLMIWQLHLPH